MTVLTCNNIRRNAPIMSNTKISIRFFDDREVRAVLDEQED